MTFQFVLADSGGTSTTWAFVRADGTYELIETESLHPKYALEDSTLISRLKEQLLACSAPLFFYGAGCAGESVQCEMKLLLQKLGFDLVSVFPDSLAVCRALYGDTPGCIGIFGTGSILVEYDGKEIVNRIGGWGSLIGDEGSGFYFGKLLLQKVLKAEQWDSQWEEVLGSRADVLAQLSRANAQAWVASLAAKTAHLRLNEIHEANINHFFQALGSKLSKVTEIQLIGSYAYHQQELFKEIFKKYSILITHIYASPISKLIDYHLNK